MGNKSSLQIALIAIVTVALLIYHAMNELAPSGPDTLSLFRIAQFVVLGLVVGGFVWSGVLPRILPTEKYITGEYKGLAKRSDIYSKDKPPEEREINFVISQNLFDCTIDGKSKNSCGSTYSLWFGNRFNVKGDSHYFILEIDLQEKIEFGIMNLKIRGNSAEGIFWSNDPNTNTQWTVVGEKLNNI